MKYSESMAAKYVELLERDLKLERARGDVLRKDVEFYRAKVERLELAVMNAQAAGAGPDYVRRTEPPRRPAMQDVLLRSGGMRPSFGELKKKWDALTEQEQAEAIEKGWNVEQEPQAAKGG